jgi:hypothetical protein
MMTPKKIDWALIGIVITLLLYGGSAVWWASKMDSRVMAIEGRMAPIAATVETVGRLDERTLAMQKSADRIERKLDDLEVRR